MGTNHFLTADEMSEYAASKGVPSAGVLVPFAGGLLVAGGLGVGVGAFPVLAAGALLVVLVVASPTMHGFRALQGEEQRTEMVNLLKNTAMVGGALVLVALGGEAWPDAVNVGLFL